MNEEVIGAVFEVERIPRILLFIIRSGIYWPLLCGAMLYFSWSLWPKDTEIKWFLLIGLGISTFLLVFYVYAWKKYDEKLHKEVNDQREQWILSVKDHIKNIDNSYFILTDYFQQLDIWQKSRDKGMEENLLNINKTILASLKQLKDVTSDTT